MSRTPGPGTDAGGPDSTSSTVRPAVAPAAAVRRQWFDHRVERWDEFKQRYWHELAAQPQVLAPLREALKAGPVTLVYGSRDTEHNQAVALREYLLAHKP